MTKAYTQMLRAFIETDPPKQKKSRSAGEGGQGRRKGEQDAAKLEMSEVARQLGPGAWPWFGPMLIFDCETETKIGQRLRFGIFQERGLNYRDLVERKKRHRTVARADMDTQRSEGIFYNPETCTKTEIATMRAYACEHGLNFMTMEDFLNEAFFRIYYLKRWQKGEAPQTLPMLIIGHNLPFDLGRLARRAGPSKGSNYGGLTLTLAEKRASIAIKKLGFGKHLFKANQDWSRRSNLRFLDTQQLGRAMLGPGNSSIRGMLRSLKIDDETKGEADYDGPITPEYVEYCRSDVRATWRIFTELRALYLKHGRTREIDRIYSEASLGKSYLKDFGVTPFLKQNPGFDRKKIGPFMEALYGGRSEVRIRHEVLETLQADFKSEYPTINSLMRLQALDIAERVGIVEGGPAGEAAQFLRGVTLADLQQKDTWPKLRGVALTRPDNDILPVRTVYHANSAQDCAAPTLRAQQIGVNAVVSGPPTWYAFADIVASKILTGTCPQVLRTIVLEPHGVQGGLKPIDFFGDPAYTIDLHRDDLFQRVIDMRAQVKDTNKSMGNGLKLLANGTAYGSKIEFIVDEHKTPRGTTVYYGMESARKIARAALPSEDGGSEISGYKAEQAGAWFAPWGSLIPAGGRLLLAIAERLASDRGLGYAFCDTDSMAFTPPADMSREDFRARAQEIAGPQGWFQALNPYLSAGSLFNIEDANFAHDNSTLLEPLYVLAVSAKRYALANKRGDAWIIRKASGHGLGHITAPAYDETALPVHPASFKPEKDDTNPLWFGVKGVWDCGVLSNALAPKLVCDVWRIAFEAADRGEDFVQAVKDKLETLPGLSEPQFQQRALSSRSDWLAHKNLPDRQAFTFFNIAPAPVSSDLLWYPNIGPEMVKRRDDLMDASLYAKFKKEVLDTDSLRRSDNNEFPSEIFEADYNLRLCNVSDTLWDYFSHLEMKSRGEKGVLPRLKMHILDHEYIGKEINSLIDEDVEDAGEERPEDLPNIPIFRRGFNPALLSGLDMDVLSKRIGVTPHTLRSAFQHGRRLEARSMARLREALDIDENGVISIAETEPPNPEAARAALMKRQLRTLHDAMAKGKGFDLNGPRRSALQNQPGGPVPLGSLQSAVERHLRDKRARAFFKDRLGYFWNGRTGKYADNEREVALIANAVALASGANRAKQIRLVRKGLTTDDKRRAQRLNEAKRRKQVRAERKAAMEAIAARTNAPTPPPQVAPPLDIEERLSVGRLDELSAAMCECVMALFLIIAFFLTFGREINAAIRVTMRRATPQTADHVFESVLREKMENRHSRREADKVRKRRTRQLAMGVAT